VLGGSASAPAGSAARATGVGWLTTSPARERTALRQPRTVARPWLVASVHTTRHGYTHGEMRLGVWTTYSIGRCVPPTLPSLGVTSLGQGLGGISLGCLGVGYAAASADGGTVDWGLSSRKRIAPGGAPCASHRRPYSGLNIPCKTYYYLY
jgi:hypothetical protein